MNFGSFRFGCNLAGDAGISMGRMMIMPARERIAACTQFHFSRANGAAVEESCPGPVRLAQVMDRRMPHSHKTPVVACGNIEHRDIAFDLAVPPAKVRSIGVADENGPGIDDPLDEGRTSERGMTVAVQHDDCAGPAVHGAADCLCPPGISISPQADTRTGTSTRFAFQVGHGPCRRLPARACRVA